MDHRSIQVPTGARLLNGGRRAKAFPHDLVKPFFYQGLRNPSKRTLNYEDQFSVRDQLYFMLLLFQGVRKSEPLHLFVDDIRPVMEPGRAIDAIRYYHPEAGLISHPHPLSGQTWAATRHRKSAV